MMSDALRLDIEGAKIAAFRSAKKRLRPLRPSSGFDNLFFLVILSVDNFCTYDS